jgi:hypothetical protein
MSKQSIKKNYDNPVRFCAALQQKLLRTVNHLHLIFSYYV